MKELWMRIPPFLSDTFGFQEIMDVTDCLGILDDCSPNKGIASRLGARQYDLSGNMVATEIRMEDVVGGTGGKIEAKARQMLADNKPGCIMVGTGPASAMIGTDIESASAHIEMENGIPASCVELTGHQFYDVGIGRTLEAMARLLVKPMQKINGSCNILGGNVIDQGGNATAIAEWLEDKGFTVLSRWGASEKVKNMRQAAGASINLVTAAAGLPLAKYFHSTYGTPYLAAAPFGCSWADRVHTALRTGEHLFPPTCGSPEILILGEQFTANAIRETLQSEFHLQGIQVVTFFQLEKSLAAPCDKRIKSEKELDALMGKGNYKLVIGAGEFKQFWNGQGRYFVLPHGATSVRSDERFPLLVGKALNTWLITSGINEVH